MRLQSAHRFAATALFVSSSLASAGPLLQNAGVTCQPSTSADVPKLEYRDGSATNVNPPPGTAAQYATVVCALPPTPPGHVMTRASISYFDGDRRWSKCYFHNGYPGIASRSVLVVSMAERPHIGHATLPVDAWEFVPHAVRCTVKPGQFVYAVEAEYEPFP